MQIWWVLGLVAACSGSSRLPASSTPVPNPTTTAPAPRAKARMTLDARGPIVSYATSSDGRLVAAVTMTEVVVWDVVGGTEVVAYPREREPFGNIHLAFTRDRSHLVVASGQHLDRFAVAGKHEVTALGPPPVQSTWVTPDGDHLVANMGTQVELWAAEPLHRVEVWPVRRHTRLRMSPDGTRVVGDSRLRSDLFDHYVWAVTHDKPVWECIGAPCGAVTAISPDARSGLRVIATSDCSAQYFVGDVGVCPTSYRLERFDVDTSKITAHLKIRFPGTLAMTPSASRGAVYSHPGLAVFDLDRGKTLFEDARFWTRNISFSPDGEYLVSCSHEAVEVIKTSDGTRLWARPVGDRSCEWTSQPLVITGHRVFVLDHVEGQRSTLRGWNIQTGESVVEVPHPPTSPNTWTNPFQVRAVTGDCVIIQMTESTFEVSCEGAAPKRTGLLP